MPIAIAVEGMCNFDASKRPNLGHCQLPSPKEDWLLLFRRLASSNRCDIRNHFPSHRLSRLLYPLGQSRKLDVVWARCRDRHTTRIRDNDEILLESFLLSRQSACILECETRRFARLVSRLSHRYQGSRFQILGSGNAFRYHPRIGMPLQDHVQGLLKPQATIQPKVEFWDSSYLLPWFSRFGGQLREYSRKATVSLSLIEHFQKLYWQRQECFGVVCDSHQPKTGEYTMLNSRVRVMTFHHRV